VTTTCILKQIIIKDEAVDLVSVQCDEDGVIFNVDFTYVSGSRDLIISNRFTLANISDAESFIDGLGDLLTYDKSSAIRQLTNVQNGVTTDHYFF